MSDNEVEVGPVDYLVVEWPAGSPPTGEAFPYLVDLVDRGVIRILDLAFVQKDEAGNVLAMEIGDFDLDGNPDLAIFQGAASGLLDDDDYSGGRAPSYNRERRRPSSCTRTHGPPRSPPHSARPALSWWHRDGSRSTPSSLPSTSSKPPRPKRRTKTWDLFEEWPGPQ